MNEHLEQLQHFEQQAHAQRETLLANLAMIGEIPSPTFEEQQRIEMLIQRFVECGLQDCATDDAGNGLAVLPGKDGEDYILVTAHADTVHPRELDHTVRMESDTVAGLGLADNSLGLAVLATLPTLLEALDIQLNRNLLLLADVESLGLGNVGGMRFFLDHNELPISAGLCLEGVRLGRLNYSSVGMLRGEVNCVIPEDHDWTQFGTVNALVLLHDVVSRILQIPLSQKPRTAITLGETAGGNAFNRIPTEAFLRFEVQSEEPGRVGQIGDTIRDICGEIASRSGARVDMKVVATRTSGGLPYNHPLPRLCREVQDALSLTPLIAPSVSELSTFIAHDIPAVTLGITEVLREGKRNEALLIEPMFRGLAQLLGILLAVDQGLCDEH